MDTGLSQFQGKDIIELIGNIMNGILSQPTCTRNVW